MAFNDTTSVSAQIPKLWSADLLAQAEANTYWNKFEGPEGSSMPVIRKDDLSKEAGDTIHSDMVLALTGAGVTGGGANALLGNEEAMKFRQNDFTVNDLSHAVQWDFKSSALNIHNLRTTALNQLAKWLAGKCDAAVWNELTGSGTTIPAANQWYPGTATTVDTLADTDGGGRMLLNDISEVRAYAEADLNIEPFRLEGGEEYYGLVVGPYTNLTLKKNTDYQAAQRDAQQRGLTNPLFTGATFVWDGVIGFVSRRVPTSTNANSPAIRYSKNVLFGAQAVARGFAMYPDWREEEVDYARKTGVATVLIKGEKVSLFDLSAAGDASGNQCIGHVVVNAAAVKPTHP